jgi:hypothetical protein
MSFSDRNTRFSKSTEFLTTIFVDQKIQHARKLLDGSLMDEDIHAETFRNHSVGFSGANDFTYFLWAYPLLSFLLMAVNLFFIVHAIKTGRPYYWVWIIFMMPVLGAAAYFFVEMRPNVRSIDWAGLRWRFASPSARIGVLKDVVENSPTVKNRTRLAQEYESQLQWFLAAQTYRECLSGVFDNDPRLLISLASALLENGNSKEAYEIASTLPAQRDFKLDDDRKLILYRSQAAVGVMDSAIVGLEDLATRKSGFAPRYYLAQAKVAGGKDSEADEDLQKIIRTFRNGNALLRKHEQQWYLAATKLLKRKRGFEDLTGKPIRN